MDHVYPSKHPFVLHKLSLLRDKKTPPHLFRLLVRHIALLLSYEATQQIPLTETTVQTPLAEAKGCEMNQKIALVPILRAGLGMVEGILQMLPDAEVRHIGLYRDEKSLMPVVRQ